MRIRPILHQSLVCFLVLVATAVSCGGEGAGTDEDIYYLDTGFSFGKDQLEADQMPLPDTAIGQDSPPGVDTLVPEDTVPGEDTAAPEDTTAPEDIQLNDVGPCGACPPDHPNCVGGVCKCTPFSCTDGTYCSGGDCVPCTVDAHCGPDCVSCPSMGQFCGPDGATCLDCDDDHLCPETQSCIDNVCTPCEDLGFCGPDCVTCPSETPTCQDGACVCTGSSCPEGTICDAGACVPCTASDPAHCGPDCLVCQGGTPHCQDGACALCNTPAACGPACQPCGGALGYCPPDGAACVECLNDGHCPALHHCEDGTCVPNCSAQGCEGDASPNGEKCNSAKVIGRTAAASGYTTTGDTYNDGNNDDLPSWGGPDCWDGKYDNFYRIWLNAGDQVTIEAAPGPADYDMSLKLYQGTTCDDDWEDDLIACEWHENDGAYEQIVHAASQDDWYTIVVDGASSFSDEHDWGQYQLDVSLICADAGCCCP